MGWMQPLRALLALGLVSSLLAGCGSGSAGAATPGVSSAPRAGSTAPPLSGTTLGGRQVDLRSLRGAPTVVVFWASWCGPCRDEQPTLNRVAQEFQPSGVHFLGVAVHDDAGPARAYQRDLSVPYDSILDHQEALVSTYLISGPPTTFVVDRAGRITARLSGPVDESQLRSLLRAAAA